MPTTDGRFDPIFDSQATFRVVLDAMARPGAPARLPTPDPRCPVADCRPLSAVLLTLLDHEVSFAVVPATGDGATAEQVSRYLASATGSRPAPVEAADYVLAMGGLPDGLLLSLKRGAPAYPDESATLLVLVPPVAEATGPTVALAGPGVRPGTTARLSGLTPIDLTDLATANEEPPLGVDLVLADAAGNLTCLPRSTRLTPL
jgi:alpha-D-ribose 1-methylphosphonate 5-triphosphate synthase subunit PhnH